MKMMKVDFEPAEITLFYFESQDVITTSGQLEDELPGDDFV